MSQRPAAFPGSGTVPADHLPAGGSRSRLPTPLAPIADPALVPSAIAGGLGLHDLGNRPPLDAASAFLGGKTFLLVLDNFEQIRAAASVVAAVLGACPHMKVLATSRELIHLYGERAYLVPPLALPNLDRLSPVAALAEVESIRLIADPESHLTSIRAAIGAEAPMAR
jgi:predicted ATPase